MRLDEHFEGDALDTSVWLPHYLPHWSSRAASAADFQVAGGELRLRIPVGLHKFRDPGLTEDFTTVPLPIDIAEFHTYAVDWQPGSLTFTVDGEVVRRIGQSPDYPVQVMLAVFDFPAKADPSATSTPVPELIVSQVAGS
jgi:hypothetical protein